MLRNVLFGFMLSSWWQLTYRLAAFLFSSPENVPYGRFCVCQYSTTILSCCYSLCDVNSKNLEVLVPQQISSA